MTHKVTPIKANENIAKYFKTMQHLRDPALIDSSVTTGYNFLYDAVYLHTEDYHFEKYLIPENDKDGSTGYSYLNDAKSKNKTKFLNEFYNGNRVIY